MSQLSSVVRFIHQIKSSEETSQQTDASLLDRFVANRDEAAFAALVKRHSAMVLAVCRRILTDHHRAEDALQACFFVLARKAASIKRRRALASWLYGVATRTALKARTHCKTEQKYSQFNEWNAPDCSGDLLWNDLRPVLDQEIERLPEKYRAPFVLCYLQSKTNAAAALELQCPEGTIVTRLARARARLRQRLSQRSVTLSIGSLSGAIDRYAVPAAVSAETIRTVACAALNFGGGLAVAGQATSAESVLLAKGVLKTMVVTKMKTAVITLIFGGICVLAAGTASYRALAGIQVDEKSAKPPVLQIASKDAALPSPIPNAVDQREQKQAPQPVCITTFYEPILQGGGKGAPVPFTIQISGVPQKDLAQVMKRVWSESQVIDIDKLSADEKLSLIFERLERMERRLNIMGEKVPDSNVIR